MTDLTPEQRLTEGPACRHSLDATPEQPLTLICLPCALAEIRAAEQAAREKALQQAVEAGCDSLTRAILRLLEEKND